MIRPTRHRASVLLVASVLAVLSMLAAACAAQPADADARRAHAIASQVMSPFCPGSTVASCSSPRAAEWRADILVWVQEGRSEEEIRRRLQQRAPGVDLSGTATSGWSWGLPTAVVVIGGTVLVWLLRRIVRARPSPEPKPGSADDDLDQQLDRELKRLDEE